MCKEAHTHILTHTHRHTHTHSKTGRALKGCLLCGVTSVRDSNTHAHKYTHIQTHTHAHILTQAQGGP